MSNPHSAAYVRRISELEAELARISTELARVIKERDDARPLESEAGA